MKSRLLLPPRCKIIGLIVLIPSIILGIFYRFWDFSFDFLTIYLGPKNVFGESPINFTDEIALTGLILGLLFIAFAREKNEDEFIHHARLEGWQWAVLINYGLLLLATWIV